MLKYSHCKGKVPPRLEDLIKLLIGTVGVSYFMARRRRVSGLERTNAEKADAAHAQNVDFLSNKRNIAILNVSTGRALVQSQSDEKKLYAAVVGDLSCECSAFEYDVCKHVEAIARHHPLTVHKMKAAAEEIGKYTTIISSKSNVGFFAFVCIYCILEFKANFFT